MNKGVADVRDTGLRHALPGIASQHALKHHPKIGASWEGCAVEEVLEALRLDDAYFRATHQGAELDRLLFKRGRRISIDCQRADAPVRTPSMRIALADLKLNELLVVYPGGKATRWGEIRGRAAGESGRWEVRSSPAFRRLTCA